MALNPTQPFELGIIEDGKNQPFYLHPKHRERHAALFGSSGVGKSTTLRNMISADLDDGAGLTVLDPHGSLIEDVLLNIPKHRTSDVIYFDPSLPHHVVGINVLEATSEQQKALVVSQVVRIFQSLWSDAWGQRTEYILENALHALMAQPEPVALTALARFLTDSRYRASVRENVTDPAHELFFATYDDEWRPAQRADASSPIINKVNKFIANPTLRAVIGQRRSSFDFRDVMDGNKILLCNLSMGALGADVSKLLGSLIITKIMLAGLTREDTPEAERRLHFLYADEIQNFTLGISLPTLLDQARKYAISVVLASQSLSQLDAQSRSAVFANCASLLAFRVSGEDAETLTTEFATTLPGRLLHDLPDYTVYARTLYEDKHGVSRPRAIKLVRTHPPSFFDHKNDPATVIRTTLERYAQPRDRVERRINSFLAPAKQTKTPRLRRA